MAEQARGRPYPGRERVLQRESVGLVVVVILTSALFFASAAKETYTQESNGAAEYAMSHCPPSGEGVDRKCFDRLSVAGPLDVARARYGLAFGASAAAVITLWLLVRHRRKGRLSAVVALIGLLVVWGALLYWNHARHDWRVVESRTVMHGPSASPAPVTPLP